MLSPASLSSIPCLRSCCCAAAALLIVAELFAVSCISGIRYMGGTYSYILREKWMISTVADYGNHIHA